MVGRTGGGAMPVVKVSDLAYARLQSPSLDEAEEFLTDFGMVRADRTADALYMRGTDAQHHIHVTHLGPSRFLGLAFHVESEDDLRRFAKAPGASAIETLDEPGGGRRVVVTDPLGYRMEVICDLQKLPPLPVREQTNNVGTEKTAPCRRAAAPRARAVASEAHRARSADDAECEGEDSVVPRDVRLRVLRRGLRRTNR